MSLTDIGNGFKYSGEWLDNKIDGNGTLYYPDGSKYSGVFLNGMPHG